MQLIPAVRPSSVAGIAMLVVVAAGLTVWAEPRVGASVDTVVYADDDRVTVVSPQAEVTLELAPGRTFGAGATVDAVTAASVDVVSQATPGFDEVRKAAWLTGSWRIGAVTPALSLRFSDEPDYRSWSGSLAGTWRLHADASLAASYAISLDTVGRAGTAFDVWSRSADTHTAEIGITQTIDRNTIARAVYTATLQVGYLEKPYRFVPLFDEAGLARARADGVELGLDTFARYRLSEMPPEEVPDRRLRHALLVRAIRHVDAIDGAIRVDYRFYVDSWGVVAHTVDAGLDVELGAGFTAQVRSRTHAQGAASFWARAYVVDEASEIPRYRTLDRELSAYVSETATAGLSWTRGRFHAYIDAGAMLSWFDDFLLLDDRAAFLGMAGVRWNP